MGVISVLFSSLYHRSNDIVHAQARLAEKAHFPLKRNDTFRSDRKIDDQRNGVNFRDRLLTQKNPGSSVFDEFFRRF